jgi:tetratricopeptide (TPR) repeat protein
VVTQLKVKLLGAAPTAKPVNREAYTLFLQGRSVERQVTTEAFEQALELYQAALALDPAYADAWVGLARSYCNQAYQYRRPADEAIPLARAAIDKALAADPEHAPAHAQLGWIETFHARNFAAAARHLERALSRDPTGVDVLANAASLARRLRRFEQAVAIGEYIVERDPVNVGAMDDLGYALLYAGRRDDGMAAFRKVLQLSPSFVGEHYNITMLLLAEGDAKGAMAEALQEPDPQFGLFALAAAHWGAGDKAKSDALLQQAIDKYGGTAAYSIALVYNARGDADRTFEWLERTVKQRELEVGAMPAYPTFAPLYADPRWQALLRDAGVASEQLAPIKFEVKLPEQGAAP